MNLQIVERAPKYSGCIQSGTVLTCNISFYKDAVYGVSTFSELCYIVETMAQVSAEHSWTPFASVVDVPSEVSGYQITSTLGGVYFLGSPSVLVGWIDQERKWVLRIKAPRAGMFSAMESARPLYGQFESSNSTIFAIPWQEGVGHELKISEKNCVFLGVAVKEKIAQLKVSKFGSSVSGKIIVHAAVRPWYISSTIDLRVAWGSFQTSVIGMGCTSALGSVKMIAESRSPMVWGASVSVYTSSRFTIEKTSIPFELVLVDTKGRFSAVGDEILCAFLWAPRSNINTTFLLGSVGYMDVVSSDAYLVGHIAQACIGTFSVAEVIEKGGLLVQARGLRGNTASGVNTSGLVGIFEGVIAPENISIVRVMSPPVGVLGHNVSGGRLQAMISGGVGSGILGKLLVGDVQFLTVALETLDLFESVVVVGRVDEVTLSEPRILVKCTIHTGFNYTLQIADGEDIFLGVIITVGNPDIRCILKEPDIKVSMYGVVGSISRGDVYEKFGFVKGVFNEYIGFR